MPIHAGFSEREYELAMNMELLGDSRQFSLPSQIAEKDLGYDIALVPGLTAIWAELGYSPGLPGVASGRGVLSHPSAPTFAASLFLQYKRPEQLRGGSAKEAKTRRAAGVNPCLPYLRYQLEQEQLSRLIDLHHEIGPLAEVCYAAALFVSLKQLRACQAGRTVVRGSNFLPLAKVATALAPDVQRSAHVWTYSDQWMSQGVLCSDPIEIDSYRGAELIDRMSIKLEEGSAELWHHLVELARSLEAWSARHGGPLPEFAYRKLRPSSDPGPFQAAMNIEEIAKQQRLGWFLALSSSK